VPNSYKQYRCRGENIAVIIYNFADFSAVIFITILLNFRGFAGKTSEIKMDDGFTR